MNEQYITSMWQEERGKPYYRIQCDYPPTVRKMLRRNSCKIAVVGLNIYLYVFTTEYSTPQKARQSLKRLTNGGVEKDSDTGGFMVKTYPKVEI